MNKISILEFQELLNQGLDSRIVTHYSPYRHFIFDELCDQFGSDRGSLRQQDHQYPWRPYSFAKIYSSYLTARRATLSTIIDISISTITNSDELESLKKKTYLSGLAVWKSFFFNAQIFGVSNYDITNKLDNRIELYKTIEDLTSEKNPLCHRLKENVELIVINARQSFDDIIISLPKIESLLAPTGLLFLECVKPIELIKFKETLFKSNNDFELISLIRPNDTLSDNNMILIRPNNF